MKHWLSSSHYSRKPRYKSEWGQQISLTSMKVYVGETENITQEYSYLHLSMLEKKGSSKEKGTEERGK